MDVRFTDVLEYPDLIPLLSAQQRVRLRVQSSSMEPALRRGDYIEVAPCPQEGIVPGDLVLAHTAQGLVCHRFLRWDENSTSRFALLQGDACTAPDSPLPHDALIGKIISVTSPSHIQRFTRYVTFSRWFLLLKTPHYALARLCHWMAKALVFIQPALIRPTDIRRLSRQFFQQEVVRGHMLLEQRMGFRPEEAKLLESLALSSSKVLVLGAGVGREAIAFAKSGWRVTAVEENRFLSQAATAAMNSGEKVTWLTMDMMKELPRESYALITMWGQLYSYIPTRALRVSLLRSCRDRLAPNGVLILSAILRGPVSSRESRMHQWRRWIAILSRGNTQCELGDRWLPEGIYVHEFQRQDVDDELREAGLVPIGGTETDAFFRVGAKGVSI